ncbi:hypothetical protein GCM10023190_15180 [Enteractinococcus fodinae]|uniref:Uncharacterized protein n=1 Tax=Enteractinococcus fodinae TaxID=684663 RepID=A0ABU2AXD7_9MICC|nr:hypothetical protein [Enteractinococcus fodinae]MDR7346007.1 hypothetical protein [Enteractinococcus fodinae]
MSANVTGGPTHWRANLDELGLGAARLQEATEQTMRLAGDAAAAGGLLAGVTIMTPQGPLIGANTVGISTGLIAMRAEVQALTTGVEYAVAGYLEAEAHISNLVDFAVTPTAVMLSILGLTTSLNVPNDMYEIAIRGANTYMWAPVEAAFTALDGTVPGAKLAMGHAIGWMFGLEESLWDVDPSQRTYGMLAHALQHAGLMRLAPYDVDNVTPQPAADGWQTRDSLGMDSSMQAMDLLQDYAQEADTVTIARIGQSDGSDAYAVMYPGTTPLGDDSGPLGALRDDAAFGATGVVEAIAADSAHVEEATLQILAQAGVPAGAKIIPMGYSQGGMHAMNVALSKKVTSKYEVSDALTVAAPTGHRSTDDLSTNFVHIEHQHDKVTALTGASNEARVNRTTVEVHGYPAEDVEAGVFGAEHNISVIDQQLATALDDPEVARATEIPFGNLEMKMGGPVAIQQFTLKRQQAPVPQHPFEAPRGPKRSGAGSPPVSIRPLDEWLTGTVRRQPF